MPFNKDIADANPGTFYSAFGNINFRIMDGNPVATVIRFHSAQHSFVSHVDFDIGSGLADLYHVANEAEDLHFKGGRYGILAENPPKPDLARWSMRRSKDSVTPPFESTKPG